MSIPPTWGDPLRYLTDDRDYRREDQRELVIMQGGNGDFYVQVVEPDRWSVRGVRIAMSGGCSSENPRLARAVADAYRAMYNAAHGRPTSTAPVTDRDVQEIVGALSRAQYEAAQSPDVRALVSGLVIADAIEVIVKMHDQLAMTALPLSGR